MDWSQTLTELFEIHKIPIEQRYVDMFKKYTVEQLQDSDIINPIIIHVRQNILLEVEQTLILKRKREIWQEYKIPSYSKYIDQFETLTLDDLHNTDKFMPIVNKIYKELEENNKSVSEFLVELTALTQKYNIDIGGCGCCGSPILYSLNSSDRLASYLKYNDELKTYEIGKEI